MENNATSGSTIPISACFPVLIRLVPHLADRLGNPAGQSRASYSLRFTRASQTRTFEGGIWPSSVSSPGKGSGGVGYSAGVTFPDLPELISMPPRSTCGHLCRSSRGLHEKRRGAARPHGQQARGGGAQVPEAHALHPAQLSAPSPLLLRRGESPGSVARLSAGRGGPQLLPSAPASPVPSLPEGGGGALTGL